MELFAKSCVNVLNTCEKDNLIHKVRAIANELSDNLENWEKKALDRAIQDIYDSKFVNHIKLKEHLDETVKCAEKFFSEYADYFTKKEIGLTIEACRIHDLGKANLIFQSNINPGLKEEISGKEKLVQQIPHGFISAISMSKKKFAELFPDSDMEDFEVFLTAVSYHHAREDNWTDEQIKEYCEKYYLSYVRDYFDDNNINVYCSYRKYLLFKNSNTCNVHVKSDIWNRYMLVKGLLNKFDYTVSAGYEEAEEDSDLNKKVLKSNIEGKLLKKGLLPAQNYMSDNCDKSLVIIAPTGSGKTEAALLWLNGEKGFYTLPLRVSSNAIYDRIRESYSYDNVSLLHSDSMQRYIEERSDDDVSAYEKYQRAKMLSAPLTVCTVDQLFKFVYKALGTEIFAATLKYSKVIIDEIQSYSPRVIATIIYGLKTITEMGGHFAIITATFPPIIQHFMEKYGIVQDTQYYFKDFSCMSDVLRHWIEVKHSEMDLDGIAEEGKKKKVLVICNTVGRAQEVYEKLTLKSDNVHVLHSRYIRRDRRLLEKMIMEFSNDENAVGIWITTQIVEASLDIDFDVLHTEMCTADSLLQRLGRCNRKGRYVPDGANVFVYDNKNGVGKNSVYNNALYERSLDKLCTYEGKCFSEQMKTEYINQVYSTEEMRESDYYNEIEDYMKMFDTLAPLEYNKKEVDEKFRDIKSITVMPENIYNENQNLIAKSLEVISIPHIGKDIKNIFITKLDDLTLSLPVNCYGNSVKLPNGVDAQTIGQENNIQKCSIHRARLSYEFNIKSCCGRGLLLDCEDDEPIMA